MRQRERQPHEPWLVVATVVGGNGKWYVANPATNQRTNATFDSADEAEKALWAIATGSATWPLRKWEDLSQYQQ